MAADFRSCRMRQRVGSRGLISWKSQPLPSGSLEGGKRSIRPTFSVRAWQPDLPCGVVEDSPPIAEHLTRIDTAGDDFGSSCVYAYKTRIRLSAGPGRLR